MKMDGWHRFLVTAGLWTEEYAQSIWNKPNDPRAKLSARKIVRDVFFHALLILSCIWTLVSLSWDISEPSVMWFQRSGAVLVAAAVASEFFATPSHDMRSLDGHGRLQRFFQIFGFIAIILGTVVWAYGDFPFLSDSL